MPTLLKIDVSPRGDYSVSKKLSEAAVTAWLEKNPGGKVVTRDLSKGGPLPFVDLPWIAAAYSAPADHSAEQKEAIKVSDELIAELKSADTILIDSPMYNFTLPAALKAYIDHLVRLDATFTAKYEGLVKGKKAFFLVASGGDYSAGGHMAALDFFSSYIKQIFGFIGITDSTVYLAGNTTGIMKGEVTMDDYLKQHIPAVVEAFTK